MHLTDGLEGVTGKSGNTSECLSWAYNTASQYGMEGMKRWWRWRGVKAESDNEGKGISIMHIHILCLKPAYNVVIYGKITSYSVTTAHTT